jgi:Formate hydrogenlyase subunit 6/NADH:ubiquinone oxidoreductase 23 kD subunit (chain I)
MVDYRFEMVREVDYNPKPIDDNFLQEPDQYPVTGEHNSHKVFAEGKVRQDADGKPYPTKLGIHGSQVAVDWEACLADGVCMNVCPVDVFEWFLNPGKKGTGNDKIIQKGTEEWDKYRTDKSEPIREQDCIFCMACQQSCPTHAIKITSP